ncbi:ABC transporter permease [Sinosporangium siamense]|uniref:Transport permease YfiM n=1 Tax=Sinosporangium siamense TaxID=1367973 RepID=A0A919V4W4_9ACTN|nr:ABC transporter permease [Sinosporangium siamense]GII90918.1 putative transport permease YfiM [Sinosporangium siamense]
MKALAFALLGLRRFFRERTNLFFVVLMPFLMIFMMGLMFGGTSQVRLGVSGATGEPLAARLVASLGADDDVEVVRVGSRDDLVSRVERGELHAGLAIPAGYDTTLRAGGRVTLQQITRPGDIAGLTAGALIASVVPKEAAPIKAAGFAAAQGAGTFDETYRAALGSAVPGLDVKVTTTGEAVMPHGAAGFGIWAPPLLLLYTFMTALIAGVGTVENRRLGVTRRAYSTPTSAGSIVLGETLGKLVITLAQGLTVMLGSALLFGVDWGSPPGAAALVVAFILVGAGAATLLGSLMRTEAQAVSVAVILGLGLGGLGGTAVPLESFSDTMRTVAHVTPHAWAYDAFTRLVRHGAGLADILPTVALLTAAAIALFTLGAWHMHRALTR